MDDSILLQPNALLMAEQQLVAAFWEKYVPLNVCAQDGSPCLWLGQVIQLANKSENLAAFSQSLGNDSTGLH